MAVGKVTITKGLDTCEIKVEGRATLDCAPPLRNFGIGLGPGMRHVSVQMSLCEWMDSTFMGTLASVALATRRVNASIDLVQPTENILRLLKELGILKLFNIVENISAGSSVGDVVADSSSAKSASDIGQTVLDAHETLMGVDESNVGRFKMVVDMVKADLNKKNAAK